MLSRKSEKRKRIEKIMKRLGRLWGEICTVENGVQAVINATKGKRGRSQSARFLYSDEHVAADPTLYHQIDPEKAKAYIEQNILPHLIDLSWKPKKPRYKRIYSWSHTKKKGKWRSLYIPSFDDHVVMHMIMQVAMPAFTRGMHPHCCGSVPQRGTKHILKYVKKWFQKDNNVRWFVKLDIRRYYDNIDPDILMACIKRVIKDKYVLWAFDLLIHASPIACPLGFYTSPYFANLLLQDLDWFIEQKLYKTRRVKRIKFADHLLRYMDDILLVGSSKADLDKAIHTVTDYLNEKYKLQIKNCWEIKRIGHHISVDGIWKMPVDEYWCDIGGYKFCRDAVIMRKGIFLATVRLARKMFKQRYYTLHQCQSLNSRIGWASHCDSVYFNEEYIEFYVDISETRRIIAKCGSKVKTVNQQNRSRPNPCLME